MRKSKEEFKLDNMVTWYLKDYEEDEEKQKKIIERTSGPLFYVFHKQKEEQQ